MYRFFFIAKNNIKKQKGDMITFFILSALSALFIFICASFLVDTGKVIDTNCEKINAADLMVLVDNNEALISRVEEAIRGNVYLKNYEEQSYLGCGAKYRLKGNKNFIEYQFYLSSYEEDCTIQTLSTDATGLSGNDAIIPISLSTTFDIGSILQLKIGDNMYDLKVAAFNEDNVFCSPMNLGTYKVYVSDSLYEKIRFDNPMTISDCRYLKTQLTDTAKKKHTDVTTISDEIKDEVMNWLGEYIKTHAGSDSSVNFIPAELMKTASMVLPFIFVALTFLFAVIIWIIAIVIINFSVKNYIMTNMKNTAIMEASGYTVRELVLILLFQLLLVSGIGAITGILAGALLIDKIAVIMLITLGLEWNQPVNFAIGFVVFISICILVGLLTVVLGRQYSKVSVLSALKGGINTHNYKKNYFSFDKTHFSIPVTLALKDTFGKFKNQLGIIFIMMILSISSIVAFGLMDTYGSEAGVLEMGGFDVYDAYFYGSEAMEKTVAGMRTVDNTRREIWISVNYSNKKKKQALSTRAVSDSSTIIGGAVIEGRWPMYPNEVMLATNAAKSLEVEMGDVVTVKNDMADEDYIVCGICQTMNSMGYMAFMTTEGLSKATALPDSMNVCINLKEGVSFAEFEKEFKDAFPEITVSDYSEAMNQTIGLVKSSINAFAYLIAFLTILIVAFVESLIVRTNINKQWRNLGVSKALGFTSRQLIIQVMLSNMPAILIGVTLGLLASPFLGNELLVITMKIFGFKKTNFAVDPFSYILTSIIICTVALSTAAFMGRRIKKLEPVKMITEE
ncbi:ABC transporter permease [Butyrivibrio sp. YAB3001]|uniref:ABC transporter permease n=1 Tax=Butyrivibrio sp. YAB3001 TaxID=1520812 RepID=UPI0008F62B35|nr:ABC transporter permease [Butyrivibrio sp. YAB3001]SFB75327.1 FtsX-like permease family protein [Butyrivibrio sp. YAB3001]